MCKIGPAVLCVWLMSLLLQGTSTTSSSACSGASAPLDEAATAESAQQQHHATLAPPSSDEAAGAMSAQAQQQHQASGAALLGKSSTEYAEQQHDVMARDLEMVSGSTDGRPALERLSSGAKRQANLDWSDSLSPFKRQELDQPSTLTAQSAAGDTAGSDTTMTYSIASDTVGDEEAGDTADSNTASTHALASDIVSAADDQEAGDTAGSNTAMTHALASDIASAADDKAGTRAERHNVMTPAFASDTTAAAGDKGGAGDSDTAMAQALAPDAASAAGDKGRAADDDRAVSGATQQKDTSSGSHLMTPLHDSDADSADCVMLDLNDEMEGLAAAAGESIEGKMAGSSSTGKTGLSILHFPLPPYMLCKSNACAMA